MENEMNNNERSPRGAVVFLYTSSIIVFLFGIALIALNIYNYSGTVRVMYRRGYDRAMVTRVLSPSASSRSLKVGFSSGWGIAAGCASFSGD